MLPKRDLRRERESALLHGVFEGAPSTSPKRGVAADDSLDALLTPVPAPEAAVPPIKEQEKPAPKATANAALLGLPEMTVVPPSLKKELPSASPETKKEDVPPSEVIWKPIVRARSNGFTELLGAVRSFGTGKMKMALIENLAMMLGAGLPLVDSLKTLQADTRSRAMRGLLKAIVEMVENGSPLWRAFDAQHCFSPDVIALLRIGEEAGNLAENMGYLAAQQEKDQALRSKVKMAMIYPTIVLVMMFVIVIGLGMFVLPNLVTVLFTLNVPLPLVTRIVIAFSNFFTNQGHVAVPSVIVGMLTLLVLAKFTPLRGVAQWVMFQIPGIGRLAREATIARFGVILGGLLQAGVPLTDAMHSLAEVTSVVSYRTFYTSLLEHITVGDSFGKSFAAIRGSATLLPLSVQQLVTTGERSGSLAKILLKIADIYEKKANETAQKLPVILEPMLLLFIGGLVGTIAFSIIVPIYSIVGNVGN